MSGWLHCQRQLTCPIVNLLLEALKAKNKRENGNISCLLLFSWALLNFLDKKYDHDDKFLSKKRTQNIILNLLPTYKVSVRIFINNSFTFWVTPQDCRWHRLTRKSLTQNALHKSNSTGMANQHQQLASFILECLHLENPYGPNLQNSVSTGLIWY